MIPAPFASRRPSDLLPGFELTVSRRTTTAGLAWLAPGDVPINESYEALTTPRLHAVKDVRSVWLSNT